MNSTESDMRKHDEIDDLYARLRRTLPNEAVKELLLRGLSTHLEISSLVVTEQYKLILPEYNNMEVKLNPKEKACYLLFLRHPEGIRIKDLPDYKEELNRIYGRITNRDNKETIELTIQNLIDPFNGDFSIQRTRIKSKFIKTVFSSQLIEDCTKPYVIDGTRGENMRISLPREKVIWKTEI